MGLNVLAEAVLRIEHKLDALLRHFKVKTQPMHFVGSQCPVCSKPIDYIVDIQHQVVVRRCDCKTGKIPSTIPLIPVPGLNDVNSEARSARGAESVAEAISAAADRGTKKAGGGQAR